ncbi:hypothetical protein MU448_11455 [Streptococcus sp. O1]|uniref:hypothetical protein n=1 Tax=Streptococcus sp. O1 TaxID=2928735 RepID=UPI00211B1CE4|nr:hypothetical protein [Streptococcus sp. O1]MCQ9214960.1 hypothetical protein [Streptococcus sp. O1]
MSYRVIRSFADGTDKEPTIQMASFIPSGTSIPVTDMSQTKISYNLFWTERIQQDLSLLCMTERYRLIFET